ncbi:MAG: YegS/Rv2252/BmrU family lipid kinase [Deferribacteres bacterium]|nr:YegS/Rv2252/BmrU family lipid kinase [candidate division KSB1 bacterium]MCB9504428.1 YegS/Rv2252/BmrU family lipid kinase [Deferribacteres bacterium]
MSPKIVGIINPVAGHRKTRQSWEVFSRTLQNAGLACEAVETDAPGAATRLTQHAIKNGADIILAVGGDGTVSEVVNGFYENGNLLSQDVKLAILPKGTGTDFYRGLAISSQPEHVAALIQKDACVKMDVGIVTYTTLEGNTRTHYFANIADLGYGGALIYRINGLTKLLGGSAAYLLGLLYNLFKYHNGKLHFRLDDGETQEGTFLAVIAANGRCFGGGMWIAPDALLDDGLLDCVLIGDLSKLSILGNIHRLYRGTIKNHPKAITARARKLEVWSDTEVLVERDGEFAGKLPVTFEILPAQINLLNSAE